MFVDCVKVKKSLCAINTISKTFKKGISENIPFMGLEYSPRWIARFDGKTTLSLIIMKVENYPDWKETSLGLPPFSTEPWLWEDEYVKL